VTLAAPEEDAMNWLDNVSSDSEHRIAPACLFSGHWQFRPHPYAELQTCRIVMDVAEPRVVAAQWLEHGVPQDLDSGQLEDLTRELVQGEVHHQPTRWGLKECTMLPTWARPSFSEDQIEELERIEGYLIDAESDESVETVLAVRDEFLKGIGMTHRDMYRAVRQPQHGLSNRKGGRGLAN
jgi:hypothetical protein